jgi:hypothetical protein
MSYREENGQVILTMSREDWSQLCLVLGFANGEALGLDHGFSLSRRQREAIKPPRITELMNRLNQGNPNYTPYQVEEKKS